MQQSEIKGRLYEYIERSDLAESSIAILERAVRWFEQQHENIELNRIRYGHVDDFRSRLKKGRAGTTANTYMSMISGFFGWLNRRGYIEIDPFDGIKRFAESERQFSIYSIEEINRILKVANTLWRTIVCLALSSMRRAEILNLHVADIDFGSNEIHIRPKIKTETTWPWQIKNHNEALVGIDESVTKMLIELSEDLDVRQPYIILPVKYWRRNMERQAAGTLKHDLRNCPWGNFTRDFKSLLRRARVPAKRFHDLRRTFCTERYRDGFDLLELQILMRHKTSETTKRYIEQVNKQELTRKSSQTFKKYYGTKVS